MAVPNFVKSAVRRIAAAMFTCQEVLGIPRIGKKRPAKKGNQK